MVPLDLRKADDVGGTSEFGFRGFSELSGDWYWEQDSQLRLTFMSCRPAEKPGVDLAAYLGRKRWDQPALNLTQADWDRHRAQVERHEPFRDFEIQCLAHDGRMVWLSLSAQPVFEDARRFRGYVGVGRDITEHKRAGQLLALEHAVARCLTEAASVPEALQGALRAICEADAWDCADFWKVDDSARSLRRAAHWSAPGMAAILGLAGRPTDAVHTPSIELASSAWQAGEPLWIPDSTQDPRAQRALMPKETGLRTAMLYPVRQGRRVVGVLDLSCRATRALEERLMDTLHAIGNQIGQLLQRAAAEQARGENEARLRSLTNLTSDWYWEMDPAYTFTRLEGRRVTGGDKDLERRLIGIRRWESGLEVEGGWDAHRAVLDARQPFFDVLMWRTMSDGRTRFVRVSGEPMFGADDAFLGYRGVGRDVTLQSRAENMLRLEHEVARALASAEDGASGLKAVILALCEAEGWDSGRYYRLEADGALRFQDGWCVNQPGVDRFVEGARMVWQSGNAVWSGDVSARGQSRVPVDAGNGAFAFAVVSDGRAIGVLAFSGASVGAPDERLQQAVRVIGSQVGQFLRRKEAEASLREGEARFRSLTQMSSDFFWESDTQHRVTSVVHGPNYPTTEIGLGAVGKRPWDLPSINPDEAGWTRYKATLDSHTPFRDFEFARVMSDGLPRYFSLSGDPKLALDGSFLGYRGIGRDITEAALTRERIASLAYTDPLTGLANRTSLGPALEQAVERARRRGTRLAGVFIDLDGFKQVNDMYGHDAGDRFLVEVARRLRANLRAVDVVARLGGDEFFVVLEDVHDEAAVENIVRKLLAAAVRPYDFPGGVQARISASIGVSLFPDNSADATGLVKHADMAMYSAKQGGKNAYSFFSALNGPVLRVELGRTTHLPAAANAIARGTGRVSVAPVSRAAPSQEGE